MIPRAMIEEDWLPPHRTSIVFARTTAARHPRPVHPEADKGARDVGAAHRGYHGRRLLGRKREDLLPGDFNSARRTCCAHIQGQALRALSDRPHRPATPIPSAARSSAAATRKNAEPGWDLVRSWPPRRARSGALAAPAISRNNSTPWRTANIRSASGTIARGWFATAENFQWKLRTALHPTIRSFLYSKKFLRTEGKRQREDPPSGSSPISSPNARDERALQYEPRLRPDPAFRQTNPMLVDWYYIAGRAAEK